MGAPPDLVVLSHPANYGDYKIGLLEEAARVAGSGATRFVPEPVAAAIHNGARAIVPAESIEEALRIAGRNTPIPYNLNIEKACVPSVEEIVAGVLRMV